MNSSVLLQTELQCVPTQWVLIDFTPGQEVCSWVKSLKDGSHLDSMSCSLKATSNDFDSLKACYVKNRPQLLKDFMSLYESGLKRGTRGRLVVWVVGDVSCPSSSLLLRDFPLDICNLCHWKNKFVPAFLRIALGPLRDQFLISLSNQYFSMPCFDQSEEDWKQEPIKVRSNPNDSCIVSATFDPVKDLLEFLLPLHSLEYRSEHLGSGGKLFLIENALVASASNWRRVDWLVLAQHNFFPRLWQLKEDSASLNELKQLLDYRQWKARFEKLRENKSEELPLIDDLLNINSGKPSKKENTSELKRRRREKNWDHLSPDPASRSTLRKTADSLYGEPNEYRITTNDFETLKELIVCMQKREQFGQSLEALSLFGTSRVPRSFSKLRGMSLLRQGQTNEAKDLLANYRLHVLQEFQDERILTGKVDSEKEANLYSEVASIALLEDCCDIAREYAMKAIEISPDLDTALKTLTWASLKSGKTSFAQEDIIFRFLLHQHSCGAITVQGTTGVVSGEMVEDYYEAAISKYPKNPIYLYFYAVYQSLVCKNNERTEKNFNLALKGLPNNSRVLNSYATWVFQYSQYNPAHKEVHREKWCKKLSSIDALYRKALSLSHDDDTLYVKTNFAAFLLCTAKTLDKNKQPKQGASAKRKFVGYSSDSSSDSSDDLGSSNRGRYDEGLELLDEVLYSSEIEKHPELAVECWFYAIVYKPARDLQESYQTLKTLLRSGSYAVGWDFSVHVSHARASKHVDATWLEKLSKVVSNENRPSSLIGWDKWVHIRCIGEGNRSAADIFGGASLEKMRKQDGVLFSTSYSRKNNPTNQTPLSTSSPPISPTSSPLSSPGHYSPVRYSSAPILKSPKDVSPYRHSPARPSPGKSSSGKKKEISPLPFDKEGITKKGAKKPATKLKSTKQTKTTPKQNKTKTFSVASLIDSDEEIEQPKNYKSDSDSDSDSFISSISVKKSPPNKRKAEKEEDTPSKKQKASVQTPTPKTLVKPKEEVKEPQRTSCRRFPTKKQKKTFDDSCMELGFAPSFFETDRIEDKENNSQRTARPESKWSKRQAKSLSM